MARYSFKLPDIGEGIAEAEIVAWHVKVGDAIGEDDPLCDMMTDKATVEMTAPVAGTIVEVAGEVGDQIAIGSVLAVFETAGEAAAEPTVEVAPNEAGQVVRPDPVPEPEKPSPLQGRGLGEGESARTRGWRGRPAAVRQDDSAAQPGVQLPLPDLLP